MTLAGGRGSLWRGRPECDRRCPRRKVAKPGADPDRPICPFHYQSAGPTRLEIPMALSGPAHYVKADELLTEIEATPALSSETETSLATRAVRARGPCCGRRHPAELIWTR
jgi:hypothetical protein